MDITAAGTGAVPGRSRRVRQSDVAAHAGVSAKTVSNVLHDHPYVSASTRAKVEASLVALGYRVNLSARALASDRTGFIALAIPGLDNPYYSELAGHVMDAAAQHDWIVLIEQTRSSAELETAVVRGGGAQLVDGVILQPDSTSQAELTDRFAHHNLVLIGEGGATASSDHVTTDAVAAAREVVEHLLAQGRTRIATLGIQPQDRANASELRYRGFCQALDAAGLSVRSDYLTPLARSRRPEAAAAVDGLLALPEPPDAILCFNDLVGSGALARLRERGINVPNDIAVAGFDDNEESRFTAPPLTSVSWDLEALAQRCVERLFARSRSGDAHLPPVRTVIGHRLVVRESTVATS
ncbi:LacI family DNA-binding transcriptional regulator [Ruania halotolerans]|uniref:LacI family DNA-binding transcriptional regulator n=1 Tax=Ruania halotolerans TaxID=2897773 RepID=UPI001E46B84E|nr:LacI family DNA-binding transcriptional regulator [Ruania halotolerans]UFU06750.1 LacI family transcriptional regulator [Ruania halotolerans]